MSELAVNRRAYHDFSILEKLFAGVELHGYEVKAIKSGKVDLRGSHITVKDGEAWWMGAVIALDQPKNIPPRYEPERNRRLLLNRKELDFLTSRGKEKGLTIIPLRLYTTPGKRATIKLEIGLVRPNKKFDKRELLKNREVERRIRRET